MHCERVQFLPCAALPPCNRTFDPMTQRVDPKPAGNARSPFHLLSSPLSAPFRSVPLPLTRYTPFYTATCLLLPATFFRCVNFSGKLVNNSHGPDAIQSFHRFPRQTSVSLVLGLMGREQHGFKFFQFGFRGCVSYSGGSVTLCCNLSLQFIDNN